MFNIFSGLTLSYIFSILILPTKENEPPLINPTFYPIMHKGMIIIPYSNQNALHIHHWITSLIICIFYLNSYKIPKLVFGFSLGLFIQGLTYKDAFSFICENPY